MWQYTSGNWITFYNKVKSIRALCIFFWQTRVDLLESQQAATCVYLLMCNSFKQIDRFSIELQSKSTHWDHLFTKATFKVPWKCQHVQYVRLLNTYVSRLTSFRSMPNVQGSVFTWSGKGSVILPHRQRRRYPNEVHLIGLSWLHSSRFDNVWLLITPK